MRRIAMMVALSVALLAVSAGAVLAANQIIRCAGIPCVATGNEDLVYERAGNRLNDEIYLKGATTRCAPTATRTTRMKSTAARAST